ncbi:serine protease [Erythrobacter sp. NAP1]|uniref:S1 family peptidase n=1 Tax=Erythrobacter sp. NAP1 TaxID=237727 RepID=UPI001389CE82|nr:serine protease [Erythrobacter sp. NAP1]
MRNSISKLGDKLVPIGHTTDDPEMGMFVEQDEYLAESGGLKIELVGTCIAIGRGYYLTCWHVVEQLARSSGEAMAIVPSAGEGRNNLRPIRSVKKFEDPRFSENGSLIDCALLAIPGADDQPLSELPAPVDFSSSDKLSVGSRVLLGGFPLGETIFFANDTNKGHIQPSFFDGIVSAILPPASEGESRLLQINALALAGMSGGVVCDPRSGKLLGMILSGITQDDVDLPITFALPVDTFRVFSTAAPNTKLISEFWK